LNVSFLSHSSSQTYNIFYLFLKNVLDMI